MAEEKAREDESNKSRKSQKTHANQAPNTRGAAKKESSNPGT